MADAQGFIERPAFIASQGGDAALCVAATPAAPVRNLVIGPDDEDDAGAALVLASANPNPAEA